jgi:hypothetical protein
LIVTVCCAVGFAAPEGYRLANASIALYGGRIVLLQPALEQRHPRRTRHFVLQLSEDLAVQSSAEVVVPLETPEAGFQDPWLFAFPVEGPTDQQSLSWRAKVNIGRLRTKWIAEDNCRFTF